MAITIKPLTGPQAAALAQIKAGTWQCNAKVRHNLRAMGLIIETPTSAWAQRISLSPAGELELAALGTWQSE